MFEHRVNDDDRRDAQSGHDLDDFVSVGTAIDAVLVLDDGDFALVEELGGCLYGRSRAVDKLADDVGLLADLTVGDAHDVTSAPLAVSAPARAALKVARPHGVGT